MVAAIPSIMGPHCLDLRARKESLRDIEANCRSLTEYFIQMTAQQKQAITEVYTRGGTLLSEREINILADNCPNISKLKLRCAYRIGDDAVKTIANRFKETLTELDLHFASNSADQTEFMGEMCRVIPQLRDQVEYITDHGISYLLEKCKKLSKIDLSGTAMTTKTLDKIAETTQLVYLEINPCYKIAATKNYDERPKFEAIDRLCKQRPDLTIVDERGIHAAIVQPSAQRRGIGQAFLFYLQKLITKISQLFSTFLECLNRTERKQ